MTGRTHGMHAEPTTFGAKLALWALQADRDVPAPARGPRAGWPWASSPARWAPTRTSTPGSRRTSAPALGLTPTPATQVVARDRHAEYLWACASVGATIEPIATEIRHMARSELGEAEEPFKPGQKGSSAMPHKRNPILSERLCGLARVLRGYLSAGLEDVALWHERDISHSSVERVVLPDASMLTLYMLQKARGLVEGLVRPPRAGAGQADRRQLRPGVQPVRAAGPGQRRSQQRRRLPDRAARRAGGLGARAGRSARCSMRTPR